FDQLEQSEIGGNPSDGWRWKRLDFSLSRALQGMIRSSGEPLSEDVTLKAREFQQHHMLLRGRQIIWMMIDYFKTNRSLQEQFTWQDIETLQWQGDESYNGFITVGSSLLLVWPLRFRRLFFAGYVPRENTEL
ncbi:MAG: hypothetical protein ACKPKO_29695, partial [Candidatus Fonsibacter sp.]